jgi:hypothetical protein
MSLKYQPDIKKTVVLLLSYFGASMDQEYVQNEEFFSQFWPGAERPVSAGGVRVRLDREGCTSGYRSVFLSLQLAGGGGAPATCVQLIFCPNWPHQSVPVSNCVHLVDCVAKQVRRSLLYIVSIKLRSSGGEASQGT